MRSCLVNVVEVVIQCLNSFCLVFASVITVQDTAHFKKLFTLHSMILIYVTEITK